MIINLLMNLYDNNICFFKEKGLIIICCKLLVFKSKNLHTSFLKDVEITDHNLQCIFHSKKNFFFLYIYFFSPLVTNGCYGMFFPLTKKLVWESIFLLEIYGAFHSLKIITLAVVCPILFYWFIKVIPFHFINGKTK